MQVPLSASRSIEFDDAGRGRVLVLLHAFPFARAMWRPQREALQDICRAIVPDLAGFGGTTPLSGTPTMERMADDVTTLLDRLPVQEPIVLGGLSMGGYVALAFARKYGSRLQALILADTRGEPDDATGKANRDKMIAYAEKHTAAEYVAEQMLAKLVSETTRRERPQVVEEIRSITAAQTPAAIIGALQAMRDRPDSISSLKDIRVPTLVLVGSDDAITPPSMSKTLLQHIPNARLAILAEAGHMSNLEQPQHFNQAVRSFLQSLA